MTSQRRPGDSRSGSPLRPIRRIVRAPSGGHPDSCGRGQGPRLGRLDPPDLDSEGPTPPCQVQACLQSLQYRLRRRTHLAMRRSPQTAPSDGSREPLDPWWLSTHRRRLKRHTLGNASARESNGRAIRGMVPSPNRKPVDPKCGPFPPSAFLPRPWCASRPAAFGPRTRPQRGPQCHVRTSRNQACAYLRHSSILAQGPIPAAEISKPPVSSDLSPSETGVQLTPGDRQIGRREDGAGLLPCILRGSGTLLLSHFQCNRVPNAQNRQVSFPR